MSNSADNELVARVVSSQDTAAFGELVRRHQSHVRNFLRKLSGDHTLADDLAQDSFIHAWEKLQTYSGRGSFIGWLLKVAYTTFLQSKRKS
ncbi:MAG: RNA polymerase sigma factor, partial [Chromatiales bacterium]